MSKLIIILIIVLMFLLSKYLPYLALKLGNKKYFKHLIFEGISQSNLETKFKISNLITIFDLINFGFILWFVLAKDISVMDEILIGYIITLYTFSIGTSLASILVYQYVISNPDQISGQTHFKTKLEHLIGRAIFINILLPMCSLIFMVPSPYILGSILAILLMLIINIQRISIY